jgi:hypothetical protein
MNSLYKGKAIETQMLDSQSCWNVFALLLLLRIALGRAFLFESNRLRNVLV